VTFFVLDYDPVWSDMRHPVKVWATSKISFNRYINDTKYRYNLLLSLKSKLKFSDLDHVQIERDLAKYFFKEDVSKYSGQLQLNNGKFYSYCRKYVCAHCLKPL
jgi:hypothetical protein